ncbi:undecaprenyl diphosphate synthase family protein [Archaeoglobus fulgidus]|uniref:Undecaprenyl pyrophosphate synthase n=1 Tax=Archaeoglobus fulgidus DSM 8774 TaxID=1344584 RepID=A0A075WC99_ARCFL|nr:undecaprenyl diphosphate synthase family protein [Archaeoglobus fulgidus]AIG97586.1 Undecaprenyl pyrophosphate synthase [Archaeoglobus fulgidus DSM 8774]
MLLRIYEKLLEREIQKVPKHIVVVTNSIGEGFLNLAKWCRKFEVDEITICGNTQIDESFFDGFKLRIIRNGSVEEKDGLKPTINILTFTGREEIINVVRKVAKMVERGELEVDEVDENLFEKFLTIKSPPDMIIKAGNDIPDFLIWQGIYAELYFADIDWQNLRYADFLRILREYQRRERRYGR